MGQPFAGNLTEHAYYSIRNRILSGDLPFGANLSRRALAEELEISIVPVGDALQRLETEGLVESRPRVGTRVRIPTSMAVRGHYIVREALESQAARLFTEKASPGEREEIKRLAAQLDVLYSMIIPEKTARERLFEIHEIHMRFHMRIAQCTGCEELCQAIEKNQVLVFNWLYDTSLRDQQPPPNWHSELANTLVLGDPEEADKAMRRHTRYRMDEVMRRMDSVVTSHQSRPEVFIRQRRNRKSQGAEARVAS
jgi:GntR family transcriptional regulator, rspAB operon transcriptional repressor